LVKNWPPAFSIWSTRSVRDAFFASPLYPRLLNQQAVKEAISKGVSNGILAYFGQSEEGEYDPIYYRTDLLPDDVEISEEWFIAKEPPKRSGPCTIVVTPEQISIKPGDEVQFSAKVMNDRGQEVQTDAIDWKATGGSIDQLGLFRAGDIEGTYSVNAAARDATGSASVVISAGGRSLKRIVVSPQDAHIGPGRTQTFVAVGLDADGLEMPLAGVDWRATGGTIDVNGIFQAGMEEGFFTITASAEGVSSSSNLIVKALSPHWAGEIPHQKWTQFYNRILSKFAARKGLKLLVAVDISDASMEEVEEMRSALRELGLEDDVEAD
jgi:hypothetical protein